MPERELTLGDILRLLLKRWRILVLLFLLTTLVVLAFSTMLLEDMYCGEAVMLVMNSKLRSKQMAMDYLGLSLESYIRLVDNKEVLLELLDNLRDFKKAHPESPLPEEMTLGDFRRRVQIEEVRNSECIRIRVYLEEAEIAGDFANRLAEKAESRNFQLLGADTSDSVSYINEKVQSSSQELDTKLDELLEFRQQASLEQLTQEITVLMSLQENWKIEKADLEISVRETAEKLRALQEEKKAYPEVKTLKRLITETPELLEALRQTSPDSDMSSVLGLGMDMEVLNPVYSTVEANISEASVQLSMKREKLADLTQRLQDVQERVDQLILEKHEKERKLEELEIKRDLAKEQFQRYETWQSQVDGVIASERQDLRLIDQAVTPEKPVGPKRLPIALTAGFVVVLIGFFGFLARDIYRMI